MVTLYAYPHCPFCVKTRQAFAEMGVEFTEVDATRGTPGSAKLIELGGKQQVPFLVHEEAGVMMYESSDIIDYAREHLVGGAA
jgi:glutaredoxin 2